MKEIFVLVLLSFACAISAQNASKLPPSAQKAADEALISACVRNDLAAARKALDEGANINAQNYLGKTPLMIAAQSVSYDMIKLLNDRGASFVYQDDIGWDAADWFDFGHKGLGTGAENRLSPIFRQNAEPAAKLAREFMNALAAGNTSAAQQLIAQDAYVDFKDKRSKLEPTPLIVAVDKGNIDAVKLILERKPRIDRTDSQGRTSLYFAVGRANVEIVKILLSAGADPNRKAANGQTVFDLAKARQIAEIIAFLGTIPKKG